MRKIGQTLRFLIPVIALVALVVFMTGAGRRERAKLEKNKAIVRRNVDEFWNKGDMAVADELYATDFVRHDPMLPEDIHGRESLKKYVAAIHASSSDWHITIEDVIAEGDKVAGRYTITGTSTGEYMGIPPTGAPFTFSAISIGRIIDGKIVETWNQSFDLGWMLPAGFKLIPPGE